MTTKAFRTFINLLRQRKKKEKERKNERKKVKELKKKQGEKKRTIYSTEFVRTSKH